MTLSGCDESVDVRMGEVGGRPQPDGVHDSACGAGDPASAKTEIIFIISDLRCS